MSTSASEWIGLLSILDVGSPSLGGSLMIDRKGEIELRQIRAAGSDSLKLTRHKAKLLAVDRAAGAAGAGAAGDGQKRNSYSKRSV